MPGRIRYMTERERQALSVQKTVSAFASMTIKLANELDASKLEQLQKQCDALHARIYELDPSRDRWNPVHNPVFQLKLFES